MRVNTSFDLEQEEVYEDEGCQLAPDEDLLTEIRYGCVCDPWLACTQKGLLWSCPLCKPAISGGLVPPDLILNDRG